MTNQQNIKIANSDQHALYGRRVLRDGQLIGYLRRFVNNSHNLSGGVSVSQNKRTGYEIRNAQGVRIATVWNRSDADYEISKLS